MYYIFVLWLYVQGMWFIFLLWKSSNCVVCGECGERGVSEACMVTSREYATHCGDSCVYSITDTRNGAVKVTLIIIKM